MTEQRDLIVIGSGPGGYVAGIRAAQLGLSVAVVEKDPKFGGTCLHRGCIPTKALLHTASLLGDIRAAGKFGIEVGAPTVDLAGAHAYKDEVVAKNAKGIDFLFKKNKVEGLHGLGRVVGANEVEVEASGGSQTYKAANILIATGSVPRDIPPAPVDGEQILNSDHILRIPEIPESLIVLGAGAVGVEFASIFAAFGSRVTLVELLPRVLPIEDEEISVALEKSFRKRGIRVLTGVELSAVDVDAAGEGVRARLKGERLDEWMEASKLLVAVGRAPVTEGLGLEPLGLELDDGYVPVNGYMQTQIPTIYAIGDVVRTPWLAHVASAEGILAVEHMAGKQARPLDYDIVPSVTYCEPEVGSVGLSEEKARARGYDVAVGKFPMSALSKAGILGKIEGFVKVVRDKKYDELLGVHIIGAHATDLIAEACVALQLESTTEELFRTMHAHPTLSEAVGEAAHAAV
ncbi:MAG: dihydrolipoyl dehydrogenase, partial [Acidobacteria bacterium]|nr:dihydrolipoyl dehydrogenase [Acidobacteriota bacterium]